MREITFAEATNEVLHQLMEGDESVFLIGQGVTSPWYVGRTTVGLIQRFGPKRVIDTPVSENAVAGTAVGAALAGLRPILAFPRMDFMYYAMDQIVNHAASWHYMFGGQAHVPLTIWAMINRGGEQAAQHSQAIQSMLMHVPGLKVVMPSTPADAKGLLRACVYDNNPVVYVDDRWLYQTSGEVPEEPYSVPLGRAVVRRAGADATVAALSYMVDESLRAAGCLAEEGISLEVIDLRSLKPLDVDLLVASTARTGRLVVADGGWRTAGAAAELAARVTELAFDSLKAPVARVTLPDAPAPASSSLEEAYYPRARDIAQAARRLLDAGRDGV